MKFERYACKKSIEN